MRTCGTMTADLLALGDWLDGFGVAAIDINPLVVLPAGRGVRALDCLIVRRGAG